VEGKLFIFIINFHVFQDLVISPRCRKTTRYFCCRQTREMLEHHKFASAWSRPSSVSG